MTLSAHPFALQETNGFFILFVGRVRADFAETKFAPTHMNIVEFRPRSWHINQMKPQFRMCGIGVDRFHDIDATLRQTLMGDGALAIVNAHRQIAGLPIVRHLLAPHCAKYGSNRTGQHDENERAVHVTGCSQWGDVGGVHAVIPERALAITADRTDASSAPPVASSTFMAISGGQLRTLRNCESLPFDTPIASLSSVRVIAPGRPRYVFKVMPFGLAYLNEGGKPECLGIRND